MLAFLIMSTTWVGVTMVIFLAGLQGIPEEYYDAAMDRRRQLAAALARVTIPLMTPTIYLNVLINIISAFQVVHADLYYDGRQSPRRHPNLRFAPLRPRFPILATGDGLFLRPGLDSIHDYLCLPHLSLARHGAGSFIRARRYTDHDDSRIRQAHGANKGSSAT